LEKFHRLPILPAPTRELIFVNHPWPMEVLDLLTQRAVDGEPLPRSAKVLAPASTAVLVERLDERTLILRPENGFMSMPGSRLGYSREHPFEEGQIIAAINQILKHPSLEVTVLE